MNSVYEHDNDNDLRGMNPMTDRLRRTLRRLDEWTLIAFNPRLPSDFRR